MFNLKKISILILALIFVSCGMLAGTLGAFRQWTFPVQKIKMDHAVNILFKNHPEYLIPDELKDLDDWEDRGYGFLDGKIFYFKDHPEEMYYVSYFTYVEGFEDEKDSKTTSIAIRAVHNLTPEGRWNTSENIKHNDKEIKRIEDRFYNEIIIKLEKQIGVKSKKETYWYEFFVNND